MKETSMPNTKNPSAAAWEVPDSLKALAILSDTTVRRSGVDWEDLNKTILEISKKATFLSRWSTILLITSFSNTLLKHSYIQRPLARPSNNLETKAPSDTYWRVQLVFMKVKAYNSLEPPLEYNQDEMPLTNQGSLWSF